MSNEDYQAIIRMRIRKARAKLQLKQEEVAEKAGITLRHYQRYEAFSVSEFALKLLTLRRISKVLAVPIGDLTAEPTTTEQEELADLKKKPK